jgi:hypothetical protein
MALSHRPRHVDGSQPMTRRHHGAVALSTAPRGSMKRGRGQQTGIISTTHCQVHVANLGPSAILAASLRSQLAGKSSEEAGEACA